MSPSSESIARIVGSAISALNEELPEAGRLRFSGDLRLVGPRGLLNSLQIVNLVIHVEEGISRQLGVDLDLTVDEKLFEPDGPLRSVDSLIDYLRRALGARDA